MGGGHSVEWVAGYLPSVVFTKRAWTGCTGLHLVGEIHGNGASAACRRFDNAVLILGYRIFGDVLRVASIVCGFVMALKSSGHHEGFGVGCLQ